MSVKAQNQTRRTLLASALAAGALSAGPAHAAPRLQYPLSLLYGRIGPTGFERIDTAEQNVWSAMAVRLTGLVERIEPIQQYSMLTNNPPMLDNDNGNVLIARQLASDAGLGHILLYASRYGAPAYPSSNNWFSRAFNGLRTRLTRSDDAVAEAHILPTDGGRPIVSISIDSPARSPLNPLDLLRDPEAEAVVHLATALESRIADDARAAYAAQRSIAD